MSFYQDKDRSKFHICNKLISRGAVASSSDRYRVHGIGSIPSTAVNCGKYDMLDVVGVSVNGSRRNRVSVDEIELGKALTARASIVKDNKYHTNRNFNTGERELRNILKDSGYVCKSDNDVRSIWEYDM